MVRDRITLEERNIALGNFLFEEKGIIKRGRRDPLTLNRQFDIARSVGAGAVQRESKKRSLRKRQTKTRELFSLNLQRINLLARGIKEDPIFEQPLLPEPPIPKDPLKNIFLTEL